MTDPTASDDLMSRKRRLGWKPDKDGRLIFNAGPINGGKYLVENAEQLDRINKYERNKNGLMAITGGASVGAYFIMQPEGTSESTAFGAVVVALLFVAGTLAYSIAGVRRLVRETAMRPVK